MSDGTGTDRLAQLTSRFEADPTSRIFLQLAEEYRHLGRVKEGMEILERGLREHPGYLAAQVAKGRCHLELGEPEHARDLLERVVRQDATQMVANKLLVRAYLETSEPERARSRLDLYALLNESDPEIEDLRRRIRIMMQPQKAEAPTTDVFDLARTPAPQTRAADIFALDPAAPPPAPAAVEPPEEVLAAPTPFHLPAAAPSNGDVFPGLVTPASLDRYLTGLAAEGLFQIEAPPAPAAPEPPAVEPPRAQAAETAATATLGELYLSQGHREEAERIFREVLRREPGNQGALAGLSKVSPPAPATPPIQTVAETSSAPAAVQLIGSDAGRIRRAQLLRAYLQRIQRGRQRNVS